MTHMQCPRPIQFSSFCFPDSSGARSIDSIARFKESRRVAHLKICQNSRLWQQRRRGRHAQATNGCTSLLRLQEKRSTSLYKVLGVSEDATDHKIRESFRRIAKVYHPDHASPDRRQAYQQKFMEAYDAYSVLKDPESRATYDLRKKQVSGFNWSGYSDETGLQNWRGEWRGSNWETDQCW